MTTHRSTLMKILGYGVLFFVAFLVFDSSVIVLAVMVALAALFHFTARGVRNSRY